MKCAQVSAIVNKMFGFRRQCLDIFLEVVLVKKLELLCMNESAPRQLPQLITATLTSVLPIYPVQGIDGGEGPLRR